MSQKRFFNLYKYFFFSQLINFGVKSAHPDIHITSLRKAFFSKLGNTGKFFKQASFISLAFSCVTNNKFYRLKIKSIILVLWNMIGAYTFTF